MLAETKRESIEPSCWGRCEVSLTKERWGDTQASSCSLRDRAGGGIGAGAQQTGVRREVWNRTCVLLLCGKCAGGDGKGAEKPLRGDRSPAERDGRGE